MRELVLCRRRRLPGRQRPRAGTGIRRSAIATVRCTIARLLGNKVTMRVGDRLRSLRPERFRRRPPAEHNGGEADEQSALYLCKLEHDRDRLATDANIEVIVLDLMMPAMG